MKKLIILFASFLVCNIALAQELTQAIVDEYNVAFFENGEIDKARKIMMPYAEKGHPTALYAVARTYEGENPKTYYHWLTKAAEAGHPISQEILGLAYLNADNIEYNLDKGLELLNKAANYSVTANFFLGQLYLHGDLGVPKDAVKSREYFRIAAINGHPQSMTQHAGNLLNVENKVDEAKSMLEKAIDAGEKVFAPVLLADNYYKKEEDRWFRYYRIAAENGNADAQCSIGDCFLEGKVVNVDYNEALKWFQKSAELGNPNAQNRVGDCYKKIFAKTLDDRYLRQYIKWTYKASENWLGSYVYNEEKQILEFVDPFKEYYEDGYLNARAYDNYEQWRKEVVLRIATGSDIDLDIPIIKRNSNAFVLVIANEDYEYEERVSYAENDGNSFVNYSKNIFNVPENRIHFIKNASLNKIKYELSWLTQMCRHYNASCYIYYAGHGIPANDLSAAYLLPIDGYSSDVSTGLNLEDLYAELGDIQSTVFIDACFSGAHRSGGMLQSNRGVRITPKMKAPRSNTIVITACQSNETAYGDDLEEHGIFTYYLLKCIKESNGNIRLGDLYAQVRKNVYNTSIKNNKVQTPSIYVADENVEIWQNLYLVR